MKRLIICICILTVGVSCVSRIPEKAPQYEQERSMTDEFTVFLTGNVLGALKPCGCSGGQLGGLDRRPAILIKYHIIIQALQQLDYDLVGLSEEDIEIGRDIGVLDGIESVFNIISSHGTADMDAPAKFTMKFLLKGRTVHLTVAAFDPESTPLEQIKELFALPADVPTLNILILNHSDPGTIDSIAKAAPFVDCVVCPAESDEPAVIGNPNKRPLAFTVGRFGRYICGLKVKAPARIGQPLRLAFKALPVEESLPKDDSLVRLYEDYQQIVKDRNLMEKHPRFTLPDGLEYAGSESCSSSDCHAYEYIEWTDNIHASAYATLEEVGSQYDPECVVCHVIGMDYESGFISEQQTPHLKDVGCENCHGPGSAHNEKPYEVKTSEPKMTCIQCHTPEHSGDYAGNEEAFMEKIKHWREPNAAGNVK